MDGCTLARAACDARPASNRPLLPYLYLLFFLIFSSSFAQFCAILEFFSFLFFLEEVKSFANPCIFSFMEDATTFHIVMLPWLAFGHLHPFLELSKSLAKRGHQISFISTPQNLRRLPDVPPQLSPLIRFVSLPLPHVDGLPDGAEATCDIPQSSCQYLKKAFDGLEQPFVQFIHQYSSPRADWIIHDFAAYWASKAGVPCIFYSTFPASTLAFFGRPSDLGKGGGSLKELTVASKRLPFPTTVAYRYHEAIRIAHDSLQPNASGAPDWLRTKISLENSKLVAPRCCTDFEADWFQVLLDIYDKPVVPVGLLPPLPESGRRREEKVFNFLDTQNPGSVIYVALGSEATISSEQLHELALGLELSGLPFLWALRKPTTGETGDMGLLPDGFEDRTEGRGLVAMGLVPQVEVLAHEAVGAFLTHCGWSSVIEGLQFGRPLVMLPVFSDQGLNARAMGEKKLGLEVERDEENGFFFREAVAKAVKVVMVEEEGEVIRSKAKVMRGIFGDKERQERYVDGFVKCLADLRLGSS